MKKNVARILIVCLLLLQIFTLIACDNKADRPAVPSDGLLITPNDENDPSEIPDGNPDGTLDSDIGIKNLILIIGDGMGMQHIRAGELAEGKDYAFTNWQNALSNTNSANKLGQAGVTTDSAAGATALASGKLTVNGYVGKDYTGANVSTILDKAKENGKATGVVTTDNLFGATPAAFTAHSISRENTDEIIASQIRSNVDLLCGTIHDDCIAQKDAIEEAGYAYCASYANIQSTLSSPKAYWQFRLSSNSAHADKLSKVSVHAMNFLSRDEDGFVLMIEQAHIDKHAHDNDFADMVQSVKSLNDTVEAVMDWIGDRNDTAVFITADHETGGLSVSLDAIYNKSYRIPDSTDNASIYYSFASGSHTNRSVGIFVWGAPVDFSACEYYKSETEIKNIDVYHMMADILQNPAKYVSS